MKPCIIASLFLAAFGANAADWPNWRGPSRTGISTEKITTSFPSTGPKTVWKAQVGIGFSSFAVADGRAITIGHTDDDHDSVFGFDASTGKPLWKHTYAAELGDKYFEGGPLSTPAIDGANVFVLSKWGDVFCLDAATGRPVWSKNIAQELKVEPPTWGFSGSPVIDGGRLFLNVGSLGAALDKTNGKVIWSSDASVEGGYCTPLLAKAAGQDILFTSNGKGYNALDPATGRLLWGIPWVTRYGVNAADPIVDGGKVFISTGYGKGCALFEMPADGNKPVYQNRDMRTQQNPCVLIEGHLYGIDGDESSKTEIKCIEFVTGAVKWHEPVQKLGAVCAAQDKLIILSGRGELTIAKASPASYDALTSAQVLGGKCWTVPVLANGLLYCRNAAGDVVCLEVK